MFGSIKEDGAAVATEQRAPDQPPFVLRVELLAFHDDVE
jgi:hypothetical protein